MPCAFVLVVVCEIVDVEDPIPLPLIIFTKNYIEFSELFWHIHHHREGESVSLYFCIIYIWKYFLLPK